MDAQSPMRGFLYGGLASCLAEGMTMPLDVLKVRMQLQGEQDQRMYRNTSQAVVQIARSEGLPAFFKGMKPALLRQGTYGTARVGLYAPMKRQFGVPENAQYGDVALWRKLSAAMLSGALAAFVFNPMDLIKVRMQADGMRSANAPPSYRGVLHAASSILRLEGSLGFYIGVGPTTARAAVVAAAELGSYDEFKLYLLSHGGRHSAPGAARGSSSGSPRDIHRLAGWLGLHRDGFRLHLASALVAGLVATAASSPFDVIKSRVMSQPLDPVTGRGLWYRGMADCWVKSLGSEGVLFMWNGFWPNYLNKGPTVVLFFLLYEAIRKLGDGP